MSIAYLGLGSNLEDREKNLITALSLIANYCNILDISSIFETCPVGYTDQPDFLNMVIKIDTNRLSPCGLLDNMQAVEKMTGRKPTFHWGPRIIDIDILYIQGITVESPSLTIPHRELLNREFMLIPLAELTDSLPIQGEEVNLKQRIAYLILNQDGQNDTGMKRAAGNRVARYKSREEIPLPKG